MASTQRAADNTMDDTAGLIPVLDLGDLTAGDPAAVPRLAEQLSDALTSVGFFFVVNHGVPWSQIDGIYQLARELHALPDEAKTPIPMGRDVGGYLGLGGGTSYASEIAGEVRKPNMNAAWFAHRDGYHVANQYPPIDGMEAAVEAYIDAAIALSHRLLPVLATSLDLPADYFAPHFDAPSCTLRLSHYPVMAYDDNEWGLAPHTDSSIWTLLPANDEPGLEIRPAGHDWLTPPSLPHSYLINSGDMLKRWTNGHYLSTAHRARNASVRDRYAMPLFFGARDDAVIEALPTCVSADRPARHEPITYGGYQRWFLNRNYAKVTGDDTLAEAP